MLYPHPIQIVILWFFLIIVACLMVHVVRHEWRQYKKLH